MEFGTPSPRTFRSFHASSTVSRLLIRGVILALALASAIFAAWFCFRLAAFVPDDLTEEEKSTAYPLVMLLAAVVISVPITNLVLFYYLDRDILRNTISIDADGIVQRKGSSEKRCAWNDITRLSTLRIGRIQLATVHHNRGKIRFDAGFVDAGGPQPHRAFGLRREFLVYPDGTEQLLLIESNALYRAVRDRIPNNIAGSAK